MSDTLTDEEGCSAWNPGVESWIPVPFRPLETLFRPEWADISLEEAQRDADLTGLPVEDLGLYRPVRLSLHELIVQVTADVAVPEGREEKDFGENFRTIVRRILNHDIQPRLAELESEHADLHQRAQELALAILEEALRGPQEPQELHSRQAPRQGWLARLLGSRPAKPVRQMATEESVAERDARVVAGFKAAAAAEHEPLRQAVLRSLYRVLGSVLGRHGRILGDTVRLARIAARRVANGLGSRRIGARIAPWVEEAISREAWRRVVNRAAPVLISLKGASAAGKSSLRPMLQRTMNEYGMEPGGYATISPDVWRRLLLHYESLGLARKYAGQLTSRELVAIDRKLDGYIRFKASRDNAMPHLVVDRFRFDSFSGEQVGRLLHNTYVRHVHTLVMYFVVTPPEETVVRGWSRALERGRYKSVEDFLAHAVEAYTGMPKLFFRWLEHPRPHYRYQFLDNRVPKGTFPTTIARGDQQEMTIVDPLGLVDIERFQKANIHAACPAEVYPPAAELAVERNAGFLRDILRHLPRVNFVLAEGAEPYLVTERGAARVCDPAGLAEARARPELAELLNHLFPQAVP